MTTTRGGITTAAAGARGNSVHSSLGTHAPLNTPTRRFYGATDPSEIHEPGVPNPNVYVVQPFKNASLPKDLVYAKKNAPDPGENLLKSTMNLINHFTSCYEAVKQQLQEERIKERDSVLVSRSMTMPGTVPTFSRSTSHKPVKPARLRPLVLHEHHLNQSIDQGPCIESCVGISPLPVTRADELTQVYQDKLRLLRKLKPELFDRQGNLLSNNHSRPHSHGQSSLPSSKKSATSSFRTPHNTLLTVDNLPFDERRTFLTEFTHEEIDEIDESEQKSVYINPTEQTNTVNELMNNNNYILKVLEIKQVTTSASKHDRTKSASEKGSFFSRKEN